MDVEVFLRKVAEAEERELAAHGWRWGQNPEQAVLAAEVRRLRRLSGRRQDRLNKPARADRAGAAEVVEERLAS